MAAPHPTEEDPMLVPLAEHMFPSFEHKLDLFTRIGMQAGAMAANPMTGVLGREMIAHLEALKQSYFTEEELQPGREWSKQQREKREKRNDEWKRTEAPLIWAEWHKRALKSQTIDLPAEYAYLNSILARIPCGDCKREFEALLGKYFLFPGAPNQRFESAHFDDYFATTVLVHNEVNRRIGKPEVTIDDARKIWAAE